MPPIASDALVLRAFALGETSKVVVLLTRERGKLRAVAKGARGARSRYRSALEPLSEVRVGLYGRQGAELLRLGECELVRSAFVVGSSDLTTSLSFSYFAELLDAFSPEGAAEDAVYRLAVAVIRSVEEGTSSMVAGRYLEAWLLRLQGVYPQLDRCAGCEASLPAGPLHYHAPAHGFVCDSCGPATGPHLPDGARAFLGEVFRRPPSGLADAARSDDLTLEGFHQQLIGRHLERELRSFRILKDVARGTQA
jgi:DNA repair protein RecO (recombination protein O)